jgi:hypothetical protein
MMTCARIFNCRASEALAYNIVLAGGAPTLQKHSE